jgi:hypothetical protein
MAKGKWVEKEPSPDGRIVWENPGEEVVGILKGIDELTLFDRKVKRARIQTKAGEKTFLLTTQLERLLGGIKLNTTIKVRYEGTQKTRFGSRKNFRVWVLEPEEPTPEDILEF